MEKTETSITASDIKRIMSKAVATAQIAGAVTQLVLFGLFASYNAGVQKGKSMR